VARICSECEFRQEVVEGAGRNPICTNTKRKQNGIPLKITTAPQWCIFKRILRRKRGSSPRALLVKELDSLAREVCLARAGYKCEINGEPHHTLHAHHIISRSNYRVRWNPNNLVCLTPGLHILNLQSAHKDPVFFLDVVVRKRGEEWLEVLRNEAHINAGVAKHTVQDLLDIKSKLKEELEDWKNRPIVECPNCKVTFIEKELREGQIK